MSIQTSNVRRSRDAVREVLESFPDPHTRSREGGGHGNSHTDADDMRRRHSIPPWDRSKFAYPTVVPNCWEHTWDAPGDEDAGGTDFLCTAKPGKGKSTLANYVGARMIDINREKVVWRGSTSRSEWLPLAPYARLCLPKGVDVQVLAKSVDPREPEVELDVDDLEGNVVREVVRYEDPLDLNQELLEPGQFHVVYPDPRMRQCQAIYEQAEEKRYDAPKGREALFHEEDPASHWWFAWLLSRVEHGPHHWTTWIADEIGDLAPESVRKDSFGSYQKVELLRDTWVDARKFGVSIFAFGHSEKDIHSMVRRKIRWRVQLRGSANPTSKGDLVGFDSVPMETDLTSRLDVGQALMYTESNFDFFSWSDMSCPSNYTLKIKVD